MGWLRPYDVLVCDNASIHEKGYNVDLADYLWNSPGLDGEPLHILLLPLPAQSPELNSIELVWNTLVMRIPGVQREDNGAHVIAQRAKEVMNAFDFALMLHTYRHCGYM